MMRVRPVHGGDRAQLASFCCTAASSGYEHTVEESIRGAYEWSSQGIDHRVLVLEDDADGGELVAVVAFRPLYPGHAQYGWTIEAIAVSLTHQDSNVGKSFWQRVIDELTKESPGGNAQWFVHHDNGAAVHISELLGAVDAFVTDDPPDGYRSFAMRLPGAIGD